MESIENQIEKGISNFKRGKIFFPNNFMNYGSSTAVRQALKRLEERGLLVRLAYGIYLYPKRHKDLGILFPSLEEVAKAIAKRDKARIIPTGATALNKLGLSTQVPMNLVYLTDGPVRTVRIRKNSIKFKKASTKILAVKNDVNVLVIQALKDIGKENLKKDELEKIKNFLRKVNKEELKHDIKLAPVWISNIMENVLKEPN